MRLESLIESILFYKCEPLEIKVIAKITEKDISEVEEAINNLRNELEDRGIVLVKEDDKICLGTNPEASSYIKKTREDELNTTPTKATLETLAIIVYKGPLTKSDIDYIRGVNSHYILRNLLIRGLVDKVPNPKDKRTFLYKPTFDLLSYLGVKSKDELPDYKDFVEQLEGAINNKDKENDEF